MAVSATALLPATAGAATLAFAPGDHTWTVPPGVTEASFDLSGSGSDGPEDVRSLGGRVTATLPVTPGETLRIVVGAPGTNGAGAGNEGWAAGGATDLRRPTDAEGDEERLLVAGGGGAPGSVFPSNDTFPGGDGGSAFRGGDGLPGEGGPCSGGGGTATAGGAAGAGNSGNGSPGARGQGGDGRSTGFAARSGAGGGGWFGGGSGALQTVGQMGALCAGGGGSSHAPGGTVEASLNSGPGTATITFADPPPMTTRATDVTKDGATLIGLVFAPEGEKWIVQVQHRIAAGSPWTSSPRKGAAADGTVAVPVTGLQEDTLYGFRLLVTKPDGTRVTTPTRVFRTLPAAPVPGDVQLAAFQAASRTIQVDLWLDTHDLATFVEVAYRRQGAQAWKTTSPVSIGSGRGVADARKTLTALSSGVTYELRTTVRDRGGSIVLDPVSLPVS